jgi:3-phytase
MAAIPLSACLLNRGSVRPEIPRDIKSLTLVGQHSIAPLKLFPPGIGIPFGGISGMALDNGGTLLGVSDAQRGGRIYQFAIEGWGTSSLRIAPYGLVAMEATKGRDRADDESLAVLKDGSIVVCAEGTSTEPRLPPALTLYTRHGEFIRSIPIRDRYAPEVTGPVTKGARGNTGFESVTVTPDRTRLFAGVESALVQDGEPATFDAGSQARIAEYAPKDNSWEPSREFVYPIEPLPKSSLTPAFFINGLADLLALNRTTLLALERGFVDQNGADGKIGPGMNTIRIYRISLSGASDVSGMESLKGQSGVVPVTKTLLLDLSQVQGLSPELAPGLDNFEGLAFGPRLPDGRATLLLVSDDNFSDRQRTWFLVFAIE